MLFQAVVSKLSFLKLLGLGAVLWLTFLLPRQVAFILHFPKQVIYVVLGSATFEFLSQWLMSVSQIHVSTRKQPVALSLLTCLATSQRKRSLLLAVSFFSSLAHSFTGSVNKSSHFCFHQSQFS